MNETNENKLVPKFRFPEFVKDGEWKEIKLIDFADKNIKWSFTGGPFGSNLKASDYTEKGVRIIQLQNIGDGEFMDDYKIYTSIEKANELLSSNIYSGELILSKMGDPVGRACIIPGVNSRFLMASDGIRLVIDEKRFSRYFVYSLINSAPIREKIEKKATGSTRKRIGLDDLREIEVFLPKKVEEQQKIADCLSSLDEVITAESERLKVLKEHKKGLLQNLFPQAGETVPKLRFKEFADSGDWEKKKLGEVAEIRSGSTPLRSNELFYKGGSIPWVKTTDLNNGFILDTEEKITKHAKAKINPEDSVLVAMYGGFNQIGRTGYLKIAAATNQALSVLNTNKTKLTPLFLLMWLNAKVEYWKVFAGSSRKDPNITGSDVTKFPIALPPTLSEQEKIASCLSSVDDLVNAQVQKIEALKLHKKGLLQGLFPVIES